MAGRPRQASTLSALKGTHAKNPGEVNRNEPVVNEPFPSHPPVHLPQAIVPFWAEVVSKVPGRVLTGADTIVVEVCATLLAEYRIAPFSMKTERIGRMLQVMAKLGLDPSARASLTVNKDKPNPFKNL